MVPVHGIAANHAVANSSWIANTRSPRPCRRLAEEAGVIFTVIVMLRSWSSSWRRHRTAPPPPPQLPGPTYAPGSWDRASTSVRSRRGTRRRHNMPHGRGLVLSARAQPGRLLHLASHAPSAAATGSDHHNAGSVALGLRRRGAPPAQVSPLRRLMLLLRRRPGCLHLSSHASSRAATGSVALGLRRRGAPPTPASPLRRLSTRA
jgi:hypothetical protein